MSVRQLQGDSARAIEQLVFISLLYTYCKYLAQTVKIAKARDSGWLRQAGIKWRICGSESVMLSFRMASKLLCSTESINTPQDRPDAVCTGR